MAEDSVWVARLVAAARSCTQLDLAGEGSANPTEADDWDPGRTIPAAAVRAALLTKGLDPDPRGLRIRGANIIGALDLEHATLPCTLTITDSRFNEPVLMEGLACRQLVLTGSHTPGLDLDGATITGGMFLDEGFTATGEVRALGANIGGRLNLQGATLTNPDGDALNLDQATITGDVFLDEEFTATGQVRALGANIGQLNLRGATLTNPDGNALNLDEATITGGMILTGGFTATGEVRARGANIGGQLNLAGATLTNPDGNALSLDGARITGDVFLDEGFKATGEVRALGANIGGQLNLRGATLTNPDGDALTLDQATITGGMILDEGFAATGEVRALGANIGGQLNLAGATLTNPDGNALTLDQATITGGMFLDEGFAATGQVTMTFATLNVLVGSDKAPGQLVVTGWRLGDIHGVLNDPKTMTSWLDAVPAKEFALQPWHEAAAVYDRQGRPTDAKRLRVAAARRVTARSKLPTKLLRTLYGWFAGYGYYPLLAGVWLIAAAIMAGTLTFFFGATQASPSGASLDPGLYGAAVVIPPAAGIIPSSWTVTSPLWLAWTLIALKAFGWLQTAILIAGLTGLLKKN